MYLRRLSSRRLWAAPTPRPLSPRSPVFGGSSRHNSRLAAEAAASQPRTVPTCPEPTCACGATPPMPEGFEIDRARSMNGVMSPYAEQLLICMGRSDWPSRIEEDNGGDNLAADLKELLGRGGAYADPFNVVSVLNASFPQSLPRRPELQTNSAYLLPSFKYIPFLPRVSFDAVQALVRGYLLPEKLHPMHDGLSPVHRDRLTRQDVYRHLLPGVRDVEDILVLICGHGGRDVRCGIMGPLLQGEFEAQLPRRGITVLEGPMVDESAAAAPSGGEIEISGSAQSPALGLTARVGQISHIGGHKFAGNVIIYIPPTMRVEGSGLLHPLAGHGIWYGRVEPKHVEGLIAETIVGGRIVADMFRGGITGDREVLRIDGPGKPSAASSL